MTPTQKAVLAQLAGLVPPNGKRHRRPTLDALEARRLLTATGTVTPLGQVTARLNGWIPTERQRQLIVALADGAVSASNAYHLGPVDWPRAPAAVLRRLRAAGAAAVFTPGDSRFKATWFGHELALILRQQPLPPPVGPEREVRR